MPIIVTEIIQVFQLLLMQTLNQSFLFQFHTLPVLPTPPPHPHSQRHLTPSHFGDFFRCKSGSFAAFSKAHLGSSLFLICKILYCSSMCFLAFNIFILLYPRLFSIFLWFCALKDPTVSWRFLRKDLKRRQILTVIAAQGHP